MILKTLKIGNLELDAPFFQASLSGYSDRAMRNITRKFNAPLAFAGVMLDKVTLHPRALRKPAFAIGDDEQHPVGAQILGTCPEMMASAAKALHGIGYDLIDLNFACPAPKVLRRQRGGYLLTEPDTVIDIFRRVRDTVTCPVMMKLRIGYGLGEENQDNLWKICAQAAAGGVDALVVHGRTVLQRYRGKADWDILAKLKRRFPQTTIIGSGDLFTAEDVRDRLQETALDGVIIARGAIGNPWIFPEIRAILAGLPMPPQPTIAQQGQTILEHFDMVRRLYPQRKGVTYFRKFAIRYCRRHPQRKMAQADLITAADDVQLRLAVKHWYGVA